VDRRGRTAVIFGSGGKLTTAVYGASVSSAKGSNLALALSK
jgi:hypothetical protein